MRFVGASGAFGSAIAYEFAKASAGLILTARNEKSLLEVVEKCKELGSSKVFIKSNYYKTS